MSLSALLATSSMLRSVPLVASVALHAGVAATLLVAAGHAQAGQPSATAILETVDVDIAPELPVTPPPVEPAPETEKETAPTSVATPTPPTHTHPYPVDPSHDARPHDPSQPHEHAHEEPAPAAHVAATEAPLPRFTIPSGAAPSAPGGATSGASTSNVAANAGGAAPGDDVTVPVSSVEVAAKLVSSAVAAYPADARADDVEGDVQLEIVVDRGGNVVEARIARPAGHGFDEAALQAIRRYRFSPAQREGRAVRVRMPWSVQFRLR